MKKLLLILLCLPMIGFGQRNLFEIGAILGGSLNNNTTEIQGGPDNQKKHITQIGGIIVKYNYSPHYSINTQLNYHITGWNRYSNIIIPYDLDEGWIPLAAEYELKTLNHYLSLPVAIEYNFHKKPNFILKTGLYTAYLIKSNRKYSSSTPPMVIPASVNSDLKNNNINRFDFGGILGFGLSYPIDDQITVLLDCSAYYGITDFFY